MEQVSGLLKISTREVFATMVNTTAQPSDLQDFRGGDENLVVGTVGFIGDVNGVVHVYARASFARILAGRMLGLPEAELGGDEMVNDVIGELLNMIVGSVKSRLCDSGILCVLTIPSVMRGRYLKGGPVCSSECLLLSIVCGAESILIELLIKPLK